jgi:hypothetical protein
LDNVQQLFFPTQLFDFGTLPPLVRFLAELWVADNNSRTFFHPSSLKTAAY